MGIKKHFDLKVVFLLVSLIFLFLLVYTAHFKHPYPFHFDEWNHIANSVRIRERGFIASLDAYPIQIGFDLILVFISFFADLVAVYKFLPAINSIIIAVVLFYFLKKEFNFWVGLFSVIFLASLKSNVNVLGLWFYVPMMCAIVLDYACLFFLERAVREKKQGDIYLVVLLLFLIALIHPSSFLVLFLVALIFFELNYRWVAERKKYFVVFLILIIPCILPAWYFFRSYYKLSTVLSKLVWYALNHVQINYNPFLFYGILSSLFAIVGYYFCYKEKKLLTFRIYPIIALVNLLMFPLTKFTLFSAYQRYLYHFMIACVPLSAVGFYFFLKYIKSYSKKYGKFASYLAIILVALVSVIAIFYGHNELHPQTKLYISVYPDEYEALKVLRDYPEGSVLTLLRIGDAVKVASGHEPLYNFFWEDKMDDLTRFYAGDCKVKKGFFNESHHKIEEVKYVHSKNPINCSFLEGIYRKGDNYIYTVELS